MLNEFLRISRAMTVAGFEIAPRHPDVKALGRSAALRVRLDAGGGIADIEPIAAQDLPAFWTMRGGQHNSFPFMQIKRPLFAVPADPGWRKANDAAWKRLKTATARRTHLRELIEAYPLSQGDSWPGTGLLNSLDGRRRALAQATTIPATRAVLDRFMLAMRAPQQFLAALAGTLRNELADADGDLIELTRVAMIVGPTLYFDTPRDFEAGVGSEMAAVSRALLTRSAANGGLVGVCALSGETVALNQENFPQPNLPILGQTFLFSRNRDIPSLGRYGRYAADAFPIGRDLMAEIAGAVVELTHKDREGRTWERIPSEKPKQYDLLLAFLDRYPEAGIARAANEPPPEVDGVADFGEAARNIVEALRAKVTSDWRTLRIDYDIVRKISPGTHKVIHHRDLTVGDFHDGALAWQKALDGIPGHLRISVPTKSGSPPEWRRPTRLFPLSIPRITRRAYVQGRMRPADVPGITAAEALSLLLDRKPAAALRALHLVLGRTTPLLRSVAHAMHRPGTAELDGYDRQGALDAAALIVVLRDIFASKGDRPMWRTGYRLGQFLAAMDTVHAGYCIDVRGGALPPTLLGNSVFVTAQTRPAQALGIIAQRWKPYGSWADRQEKEGWPAVGRLEKKRRPETATSEISERRDPKEWVMINAKNYTRRFRSLCAELDDDLPAVIIDDNFRADLLLGYLAGLPFVSRKDTKPDVGEEAAQ